MGLSVGSRRETVSVASSVIVLERDRADLALWTFGTADTPETDRGVLRCLAGGRIELVREQKPPWPRTFVTAAMLVRRAGPQE